MARFFDTSFPLREYHGMSVGARNYGAEGIDMCNNNNGLCGCLNNNWWWIIILILLFCNCGNNGGCFEGNNNCGCC